MEVREIVSDDCYLGWPLITLPRANRQMAYIYLGPKDGNATVHEKDNGGTAVTVDGSTWTFSPGLEPVIIRRRV